MEQVHSREDEFPISRDIQGKKFSPSMNISNLFLPHMYSFCSSHQEGTLLSPLGIHFLQTLQGLVEIQHFPQSLPTLPTLTELPFSELVLTTPVPFTSQYDSIPVYIIMWIDGKL